MISKNKNLFLKIYIPFVIIISVALIILQILGSKNRVGYLTDFNLNIERMLNLYDLENIIEDFTVDGELDEESIKNYLLTNENITNYVHHFRIRYYDKTFRNNDIYGVYPDLSNLPDYMENAVMEDGGSPYGNFISDKKEINEEKIDNINYTLRIKPEILILLYFILILILIIYFYRKLNISNDKKFIIITIFIGLILFIFQFWLCFPGMTEGDTWFIFLKVMEGNNYSDWHNAFIQIFLNSLCRLFGYHTFYMFLFNLIFWYIGLSIIIISLYLKFKNKYILWLFALSFLPNIFYMNIWKLKDTFALSFFWIASSLIFFTTLIKVKNNKVNIILNILSILLLICAMLSRHNFIVTVYPVFLIFAYRILKNKNIINIKQYAAKFLCIMLLFAICLLGIYKLFPKLPIIDHNERNPTNPIYALQIARIAVLSNDESVIPSKLYQQGKGFNDILKDYENFPARYRASDYLYEYTFYYDKLNDGKKYLIKAILKQPVAYINFLSKYAFGIWSLNLNNDTNKRSLGISQVKIPYNRLVYNPPNQDILTVFDDIDAEYFMPKQVIYKTIYILLIIDINMIVFVILSLVLFLIPIIICILKPHVFNDLLLMTFTFSFSAFATAIIVGVFTPGQEYRYIYPVCPISILSLISFITFIYDRGGFKKFFKELKGGENK